jgi:phosphatidylglycerophosphate synthase
MNANETTDAAALKARYEATLNHPDTEEGIDLLFYRPLGFRFALWAERHGVVPNAISVLSIFLGVGAGLLFYPDHIGWNVLGIVLLILADICDSADGQLARMTRRFSRLGRILDGVCGDLWFISIYVAICCRLNYDWGYTIWLLAAAAGACHSLQAAMADYYRNFHLFFVKGKSGSELEDARQVAADYRAISFRREPLYKVFMFFYRNYTRQQEFFTPQMQRLRAQLRLRFEDQPIPAQFCAVFRLFSLPLMKYTNILSFNCRAILLSISLLCGEPWIYFVGELTVFNLLLFYMTARHEIICRRFAKRLEAAG